MVMVKPAALAQLNQPSADQLRRSGLFCTSPIKAIERIRRVSPSGPDLGSNIDAGSCGCLPAKLGDRSPSRSRQSFRVQTACSTPRRLRRAGSGELPPPIPPDPATLITIVNAASLTGPLAPGMLARVDGIAPSEVRFAGILAAKVSDQVIVVRPQVSDRVQPVWRLDAVHLDVAIVATAPALFVAVNEDGSVERPVAPGRISGSSSVVLYGTGEGVGAAA